MLGKKIICEKYIPNTGTNTIIKQISSIKALKLNITIEIIITIFC